MVISTLFQLEIWLHVPIRKKEIFPLTWIPVGGQLLDRIPVHYFFAVIGFR
jgi:hypothetical protein